MSPASAASEALEPLAALGLGVLQGVAEFLPISSSGHLSLAQAWLGIAPSQGGHVLNVVLHAGTLLAVLWVYRSALHELVTGLLARRAESWREFRALIIGSLPLVVVLLPGVEESVVRMEGEIRWVGVALCLTAAALAYTHFTHDRRIDGSSTQEKPVELSARDALLVGIAQLFAVTPGVSRSGSTIAAALALGLSRERAARFSFLLSIPAVSAATLKTGLEILGDSGSHQQVDLVALGLGFAASLIAGLAALRALLAILERVGLLPFVPYLLAVGMGAIILG